MIGPGHSLPWSSQAPLDGRGEIDAPAIDRSDLTSFVYSYSKPSKCSAKQRTQTAPEHSTHGGHGPFDLSSPGAESERPRAVSSR